MLKPLVLLSVLATTLMAQQPRVPAGSKVYVHPMDGFGTFVTAALIKKEVPVVVVNDREKADYEITGTSESQKAGVAKMLIMGSAQSREEASITVAEIKSGQIAFSYSVNKGNAARGKQSAAEACAKHFRKAMEGKD